MLRLRITIFCLLCMLNTLHAQWTHLTFYGGTIKKIVSVDSTLYALSNSNFYKSENFGITWEEKNTANLISALDTSIYRYLADLSNLIVFNKSIYFYAPYRLVVSHDGGNTWLKLKLPHQSEFTRYFVLNNVLHAFVNANKTFYKYQDNTWTELSTLNQSDLFVQIDTNKILINIVENGFKKLCLTQDVNNFSEIHLRGVPKYDSVIIDTTWNYFYNVRRITGNNKYTFIVAQDSKIFLNNSNQLHNPKSSWALISDSIKLSIKYISNINFIDNILYVSLQTTNNKFYTYYTEDFGKSYHLDVKETKAPSLVLNNIYFKNSDNGVLVSNDKGVTWESSIYYFKDIQIDFIKKSKNRIFAYDRSNLRFIYSDDRGLNWILPQGLDSSIYTYNDGFIITDSILFINCNGVYFKSYDNGSIWINNPLQIDNTPIVRIYNLDMHGFVVMTYKASTKVYKIYTTKNFINYTEFTSTCPILPALLDGGITYDANYVYMWELYNPKIYKSNNFITWQSILSPKEMDIDEFFNLNNTLHIITTVGDYRSAFEIYKFDGNQFLKINYTGLLDTIHPQPIIFEKGVYYTIDRLSTNIYYSKNLSNWFQIENDNFLENVKIKSESFIAIDSTVIIGTWSSGIYRYNKLLVSREESKLKKNVVLYPNPAKGFIYLQPAKEPSHYKIFNVIGVTYLQGKYDSNGINIEALDQGIYFIEVQENDQKYNLKFIVE